MTRNLHLRHKGSYLFSDSEMEQRKSVSKDVFIKEFSPFMKEFIKSVIDADDEVQEDKRKHPICNRQKTPAPSRMNGLTIENVYKIPGIRMGQINGRRRRVYISLDSSIVFIKNLDEKLRPKNAKTMAVKEYHNQLTQVNRDNRPIVYVGWVMNDRTNTIEGIFASCFNGDERIWEVDIIREAKNIQNKHIVSDQQKEEAEVTINVMPKEVNL